jgi:hypothetical protein
MSEKETLLTLIRIKNKEISKIEDEVKTLDNQLRDIELKEILEQHF